MELDCWVPRNDGVRDMDGMRLLPPLRIEEEVNELVPWLLPSVDDVMLADVLELGKRRIAIGVGVVAVQLKGLLWQWSHKKLLKSIQTENTIP